MDTRFSAIVADKLCTYFECNIEELVEHIPDDKLKQLEEQRIAK